MSEGERARECEGSGQLEADRPAPPHEDERARERASWMEA